MPRRIRLAGLILLVVIWGVVLLTPKLRLLLRAQAAPQWPNFLKKIGVHDDSFARVLREHPNDPRVLEADAEMLTTRRYSEAMMRTDGNRYAEARLFIKRNREKIAAYDVLINKFPNQLWLLQNRLRLTMSDGPIPYDGEFSRGNLQPATKKPRTGMTHGEMLQALKIAERGARLDPQNSFYDWMRGILLFGLQRDEDALKALQQGSRKSRYDDGVLRDAQNRIAVAAMQSPLLWEDRAAIIAGTTMPHYSMLRNTNRAAVWRGVLAERRDNHKRALEIYGAQMRLARLMRRDSSNIIGIAVGEIMEQGAWGAIARKRNSTHEPGGEAWEQRQKDKMELAKRFANYARAHGRQDLAKEALHDVGQFEIGNTGNWFETVWFGVPTTTVEKMLRLNWTNAILLRAVLVSTLAWLFLRALLWRAQGRSDLKSLSALDLASSTLFVVIGVGGALSAINANHVDWMDFMLPAFPNLYPLPDDSLLALAPKIVSWLPLALTIFYCGFAMSWRGRPRVRRVLANEDEAAINENTRLRLNKMIFAVVTAIFAILWWQWLLGQRLMLLATLPGLLLPFLIAFLIWPRVNQFNLQRPSWNVLYGLAWCRSTLGAFIVIGSLTYFVCGLFTLPIRNEANIRLDDILARGEVALIREQMNKK